MELGITYSMKNENINSTIKLFESTEEVLFKTQSVLQNAKKTFKQIEFDFEKTINEMNLSSLPTINEYIMLRNKLQNILYTIKNM